MNQHFKTILMYGFLLAVLAVSVAAFTFSLDDGLDCLDSGR